MAAPRSVAELASVEPDHAYVFVSYGGEAEAESLRAIGFHVDTTVTEHSGGGTASRSAIFQNFYLELIWVDSTVSVSTESRESFADMQRAASWRTTGASPFGLGLRKVAGPDEFGVPVTFYSDTWMRPGTSITLLDQASEPMAFALFVVPPYMAVPAWIDQAAELVQHENGARQLTGLEIRGPVAQHPTATRALRIPGLTVTDAAEPMLVLEFDGGRTGVIHDLHRLMPVTIRM